MTTKEHSGLSQVPALCSLPHTPMGGGDGDGHERERNMFGLQISQNIGSDPWWGVRKSTKTSSLGDADDTPRPSQQNSRLRSVELDKESNLSEHPHRDYFYSK